MTDFPDSWQATNHRELASAKHTLDDSFLLSLGADVVEPGESELAPRIQLGRRLRVIVGRDRLE